MCIYIDLVRTHLDQKEQVNNLEVSYEVTSKTSKSTLSPMDPNPARYSISLLNYRFCLSQAELQGIRMQTHALWHVSGIHTRQNISLRMSASNAQHASKEVTCNRSNKDNVGFQFKFNVLISRVIA